MLYVATSLRNVLEAQKTFKAPSPEVLHEQKQLLNELLQALDVPTLLLCGPRNMQERLTQDALGMLEPFTKALLLHLDVS